MSKLFGEFKTPSISDWKKLTAKELNGANIDELQLWLASDGFQARPAYFREETQKLPSMGASALSIDLNGLDFARDDFNSLFDGVLVDAIWFSVFYHDERVQRSGDK